MNYTGSMIIARVRDVLQDAGATAWPNVELERWLNDARSRTYELRPDLFAVDVDVTCVDGPTQTLPDGGKRLLEPRFNVSHRSKRQITMIGEDQLARFRPGWRTLRRSAEILHVMYDEADGASFDVYPPAIAGTVIKVGHAKPPAAANSATTLTEEGELAIHYVDYVLARAFQKESDTVPAFFQRAAQHMGAYEAGLGSGLQVKVASSPNAQKEGGVPPREA